MLPTPLASINQTTSHQTLNQNTLQMGKKFQSPALDLRIPRAWFRHMTTLDVRFATCIVIRNTRGVYWRTLGVLSIHLTTLNLLTGLSQAKSPGRESMNISLSDFRSLHRPASGPLTSSINISKLSTRITILSNGTKGPIHTTAAPPPSFTETLSNVLNTFFRNLHTGKTLYMHRYGSMMKLGRDFTPRCTPQIGGGKRR